MASNATTFHAAARPVPTNALPDDGKQSSDPDSDICRTTTPTEIEQIGGSIASAIRTALAEQGMDATALRNQTIANVNVVLALYKHGNPPGYSAPSIIVAYGEDGIYAAVVRTWYNGMFTRTQMDTTIEGPGCESEHEALRKLFEMSMSMVQRARELSETKAEGFADWDDLDLE